MTLTDTQGRPLPKPIPFGPNEAPPLFVAQFWVRAVKQESGCWEWTGSRNRFGHGEVSFRGQLYKAHRIAWQIVFGTPRDQLLVLHRCDNPCCINPGHLFLGTHEDNFADMRAKGRHSRGPKTLGEHHGPSKLREAQVIQIKNDLASGRKLAHIAAEHGVTASTIYLIKAGKNWKHLSGADNA